MTGHYRMVVKSSHRSILTLHFSTFITANLTLNLVTEIFFYAWRWNTKKRSSCAAIETCVAVSKKCPNNIIFAYWLQQNFQVFAEV